MTRAVLDVNVLISALIAPSGIPARILELWREEKFVLLVSEPILDELERVLAEPRLRRRHGLAPSRVARLLRGLRQFAVVTPGELKLSGLLRDEADHKFLACAVEGQADYLVTGDEDLLTLAEYKGIPILSPAAFVRAMADRQTPSRRKPVDST